MTSAVPQPTGPYPVGRTVRQWTDPSRTDPYAADPSEPRSLVLWIWYPASPTSGPPARARGPPARDLPGRWLPTPNMLGIRAAGLPSNSAHNAAPAEDRATYPV